MYYALIILSVVMFGGCFGLQDVYRKIKGSGIKISLEFSLVGSIAGFVLLLMVNSFKFEFTPFTLIMAFLASINGFANTFCSFKALDRINLSLYSLFSMLGGMVLPFLQGILFYDEKWYGGRAFKVFCRSTFPENKRDGIYNSDFALQRSYFCGFIVDCF